MRCDQLAAAEGADLPERAAAFLAGQGLLHSRSCGALVALIRAGQAIILLDALDEFTERRTRCGHPTCRCRAAPPRLHGPYWQWTRKVAARTVGRWLSADQHHDYQTWISNDRRLRELLSQLEALGITALENDPRSQRQARSPAEPAS